MGRDDDLDEDDDFIELPPEAFVPAPKEDAPADVNDAWLVTASAGEQRVAMRRWFHGRFCDPAMGTPYDSEVGYIYVHGGPYSPSDELSERFGDIVNEDLVEEVVEELGQVSDEWAPIYCDSPDDYDDRFDLHLLARSEPLSRLSERLRQFQTFLTLQSDASARALAQQLVFGAAIGALEAFLWETAQYWIENDRVALHDIVTKLPVFRDEPIKLGDVYKRQQSLKDHVKGHLQTTIWHRSDKVAPLFQAALGIRLPSMKQFDAALIKRHDIVHRSGNDKDGRPVTLTAEEIQALCSRIEAFGREVDASLASRVLTTGPDNQQQAEDTEF